VRAGSGAYAVRGQYSVIIRFLNSGPEPVYLLKPLDGSMEDVFMPYYRIKVWDADNEPLKPLPRCGNFGGTWWGTEWPQDYLVELKPGASLDRECLVPYEIPHDGRYNVSFEYVYEPRGGGRLAPPPGAWRGSVKAPTTVVDLKLK
jgi:hypothetical protein